MAGASEEEKNATQIALQASNAAANASSAASSAANAASQAATNAQIAAKAAADSATAIAIVATDTSWMKKSLARVEDTLSTISNSFVSIADHQAGLQLVSDHEKRLTSLETEKTKTTVLISVGIGLMSLLTSIIVYHVFQGK